MLVLTDGRKSTLCSQPRSLVKRAKRRAERSVNVDVRQPDWCRGA